MYHTLVLKPTNSWKFAFESRIAPARCGETALCDLSGAPVKCRCALFHPPLRFRKVCTMKLSHSRGSLQILGRRLRASRFSRDDVCAHDGEVIAGSLERLLGVMLGDEASIIVQSEISLPSETVEDRD